MKVLVSIILVLATTICGKAQSLLPETPEARAVFEVDIDLQKAYISGRCYMLRKENSIVASIVNEFGVSIADFTYDITKHKTRIHSLFSKLNHWYIKKMLKKDISSVMNQLDKGESKYINSKRKMTYTFTPVTSTPTSDDAVD